MNYHDPVTKSQIRRALVKRNIIAVRSHDMNRPVSADEPSREDLLGAYRTADDCKEDVYLITRYRDKLDTREYIPYLQLASQADDWEKANGKLIQWRVK